MTAHPRSSRTGATHVTPFEQKGAVGLSPGELIEDVKNAVREPRPLVSRFRKQPAD